MRSTKRLLSTALGAVLIAGGAGQVPSEANAEPPRVERRQDRRDNKQERRETHRDNKQERREDHRDNKQERREDHRDHKQERREHRGPG